MSRQRGSRGYALSLPLLLVLTVTIAVPIGAIFYGAVQSENPGFPDSEFTLDALQTVYTTWPYIRTLLGTILLSLTTATLAVAIGSAFAWLQARAALPFPRTLETIVIAPLFLSPFIGAVAWVTLAAPRAGILNVAARQFLPIDGHLIDIMTTGGMVAVMALYYVPVAYLLIVGSLRNMDPSLEEASQLSGASTLKTAIRVTLGVARPAMVSAFFFVGILSAGLFAVPAVLGRQGGFVPLAVRVYRSASIYPSNFALAASIGTVLFWVTLLGIYWYRRHSRTTNRYVTVTARGTRARPVSLGKGKPAAVGLYALYGLVAVALPYLALIVVAFQPYTITDLGEMTFTLDNVTRVFESGRVREALVNTSVVAVVSSTLSVLLAALIAYSVMRYRNRVGQVIEYLATLPIAVPGIVFASGMIWVYIRTPMYATIWILVVAYIVTYLPTSVRLAGVGFMQVDPALEEAAVVSGIGRASILRRISLPIIKPSLLAAWTLTFIFVVREINAAILLYSPNSYVLSVLTWDYLESGTLQLAGTVGLVQTLLLLLGVALGRFVFKVKLAM